MMKQIKLVLLSIALVLLVFVKFITSVDQGGSGCNGKSRTQTFKYEEGTTYKYNLEGRIVTSLSTVDNQSSTTKITATVLLTQLSQCNQLLRLQHVEITGPNGKRYENPEYLKNEEPIRFNFEDGLIGNTIYTYPQVHKSATNIQRAILSLLQLVFPPDDDDERVASAETYELDIFGVCPTNITTQQEGANLIVYKSRNLNKCKNRDGISQDFRPIAGNDGNNGIESAKLLNAHYVSEQHVRNGILNFASATENYLLLPFSVEQNGAKATVSSKLQLTGSVKDFVKDDMNVPHSIIFENPHVITTEKSSVDAISNALNESRHTPVGKNSPSAFFTLVDILKPAQVDYILSVFHQFERGARAVDETESVMKVFLDAIFSAGTDDCIKVGIKLLQNKDWEPLVFSSLSLLQHPNLNLILTASKSLDQVTVPHEVYIAVGTLTGRYCREHPCYKKSEIKKLVRKLLSKIETGVGKTRQKVIEMIDALSGLRNMDMLTSAAVKKVTTIAQSKNEPASLRVAALEAYFGDACGSIIRNSALNLLKDFQQNSEIRIKAYLVLAKCPTQEIANSIENFLHNTSDNQVGGFIVSHIHNLKASTNPDKNNAKQILGKVSTNVTFDSRKLSFHKEYSTATNAYGLSSAVESYVIYSEEPFTSRSAQGRQVQSYLPQHVFLNLTTQLFGKRLNLLEVDLRNENSDETSFSMKYFGSEISFQRSNSQTSRKHIGDKEKSIRSNCIFFNLEYGYPTSLGFALRANLKGASTAQVNAASNVDILNNPQNIFELVPSAALEVASELLIDAHVVESGLTIKHKQYTATEVVAGVEQQKLLTTTNIFDHLHELDQPEQNELLYENNSTITNDYFSKLMEWIFITPFNY